MMPSIRPFPRAPLRRQGAGTQFQLDPVRAGRMSSCRRSQSRGSDAHHLVLELLAGADHLACHAIISDMRMVSRLTWWKSGRLISAIPAVFGIDCEDSRYERVLLLQRQPVKLFHWPESCSASGGALEPLRVKRCTTLRGGCEFRCIAGSSNGLTLDR